MNKIILLFSILFQTFLFSQKIDNTSGLRNLESDRYFRFNYDNDFFASSNKDYTQGYNFELAARFPRSTLTREFYSGGSSKWEGFGVGILF